MGSLPHPEALPIHHTSCLTKLKCGFFENVKAPLCCPVGKKWPTAMFSRTNVITFTWRDSIVRKSDTLFFIYVYMWAVHHYDCLGGHFSLLKYKSATRWGCRLRSRLTAKRLWFRVACSPPACVDVLQSPNSNSQIPKHTHIYTHQSQLRLQSGQSKEKGPSGKTDHRTKAVCWNVRNPSAKLAVTFTVLHVLNIEHCFTKSKQQLCFEKRTSRI